MKQTTLALIALAAAFAGQSSLAQTAEADVEIVVVTGQRLAENERPPVAIAEPKLAIDFSALRIIPPPAVGAATALEPPRLERAPLRIELARAEPAPAQG